MTKRVLLVSDEPAFFDAPENAFQTRGCDVFTAMDGSDALEFLSTHGADLVLTKGAPDGFSASKVGKVLGDAQLVIVAPKSDHGGLSAFKKIENVHIMDAPIGGKALLKLTASLLDISDRKFISILVQVRVTKPKTTTIFGKSRDLSAGGLLVETNQQLILHDKVVVSFLIPGAERMIQADAAVMREVPKSGSRRYGLKFIGLQDEDEIIIGDFLSGKLSS